MTRKPSAISSKVLAVALALGLGVFVVNLPTRILAFEAGVFQVKANDPGFTLDGQNIDKQWGLIQANFPAAWEKTTGATSTVVAIVDTGVDETHEDLKGQNFVGGFDFINNQALAPESNSDDNGHGTLVAGVIGAIPDNNKGVAGTNWRVSLMPIKALDSEGKGDSATVEKAIMWAADHGANIINLSLGGAGFEHDSDLAKSIAYAFNKGLVIVAAAGNDSSDTARNLDAEPVFPVCDDNDQNMVIGVTAVDQTGLKPAFANYGKSCVDVAAPGKRILSTISIDPLTKRPSPNSYAYVSGTSLAAAFVSGEAALIKSLYPTADNKQIRDRILAATNKTDYLNQIQCGGKPCFGLMGYGAIDAGQSLSQGFPLPYIYENDIVKAADSLNLYWVHGGQKRLISAFVYNQRFSESPVKVISPSQLSQLPEGAYATPLEGTLIKAPNDPAVFIISSGLKIPITYQVFRQRGYNFADVNTVDTFEFNSWISGKFLAPKEGTLVKTPNSPALYWTIGGALHPINWQFFVDRGLKVFPILTVTQKDFLSYNMGEAYIR